MPPALTEPIVSDPLSTHASRSLPYAQPDARRPDRPALILPGASIIVAMLGFPAGAFTSIILDTQRLVPHMAAERGGFMLFAMLEGLAAACGLLGAMLTRGKNRQAFWIAVVGTILGAVGSGVVLFMIAIDAIK